MLLENCAMAVIRASRPTFKNSHDKLAFSLHATFIAYGYLLTAVGLSAIQHSSISSSSSSSDEVSVDGWNSLDEDYAFVYLNPHSSEKFLIRCIAMNENLLINVSRSFNQSDIIHLEIDTEDYVEEGDADKSNYKDYFKNFPMLINSLKTQLFSKLSPSDSLSSSTSTSDGMQVYQYPYPRVPVYHGPANQK